MIRVRLPSVPDQRLASPTLQFDKFHAYDAFEGDDAFKNKEREQWLRQFIIPAVDEARAFYRDWHDELDDAAQCVQAKILLSAKTDWRLVIGWASNPALEIGLTLHRLYGFPYLPGSAVKGLVHRMAEIELMESHPVPDVTPATVRDTPATAFLEALDQAALIRAIFGSLHISRQNGGHVADLRRPPESDLPATALESLEQWRDELRRVEALSDEWKDVLGQIELVCGAENLAGVAVFFDAVPEPAGLRAGSPLQVDVLTPHYGRYYRDLDSERRTVDPVDSDDPNPLKFLAVRPGLQFEFRARVRMPRSQDDESGREQLRGLAGRDAEAIVDLLRRWLERGLQEMGIGAKTAAGYGYLAASPVVDSVAPPVIPLDPEQLAVQILPPNLPMNILPQRVDDARDLPVEQQAAVARRLVALYPQAVKTWRRQKDKAAAQERVKWVDQMITGHGKAGDQP